MTTRRQPDRAVLGQRGEVLAARWLTERGYRVVARGWRLSTGELRGELDIVATRDRTLVVVEVKTRRGDRFGGPLAAVTPQKQARIRALAAAYLHANGRPAVRVRFDVIAVVVRDGRPPAIRHVPAAF